ncbi:uncharacterized protein F4817DRAFT_329647 [Daldinia loculata]|uniref:uncharacterized protein n=1 Tax=Daldinia loculata TaxID=103429 RepID=UPI0020C34107|nr:uncharacterized protein F4817DRAFT_329647 [Daldinia loculata]KAI1650075.1 hypothetical protein F4817DRAFT_329647 [Daldinia loculata]
MLAFNYFILSFIGIAHGLPILLAENKRDQLINLSPNLDLGLDANNDNSCLGLGISVCDPITVDSEKNSTVEHDNGSKAKEEPSTKDSDSGDSLINLSPDVDLGLDLSNENSCLGIGISACDPITVGSDVTKTVKDGGDEAKVEPSSAASTTPAPTAYPVQPSPTSGTSATSSPTTKSSGNSLLDLSPKIAPDLNLSNDNSCQGIGISVCDPITVDSVVKNISS